MNVIVWKREEYEEGSTELPCPAALQTLRQINLSCLACFKKTGLGSCRITIYRVLMFGVSKRVVERAAEEESGMPSRRTPEPRRKNGQLYKIQVVTVQAIFYQNYRRVHLLSRWTKKAALVSDSTKTPRLSLHTIGILSNRKTRTCKNVN
jgi:hypothetical protein